MAGKTLVLLGVAAALSGSAIAAAPDAADPARRGWYVGGGVDLYATDHVVVNAEATYDLPTGRVSDLRFVPVKLGAQYRF